MHSKSYSEHLRNSQYCGLRWRILLLKPDAKQPDSGHLSKIRVIRERCNSKACQYCARRKFNQIRNRLRKKSVTTQWRFFTLTSINSGDTSHADLEKLENDFRELRKKLKRQFPNFQYIAVKELSPSGMWHYHGLWNIYIDIKLLSKYWEKISGAYRCNLQTVRNPQGAVNYIFKYCFKSVFNEPERRALYECDKKKFTTSRGLLAPSENNSPYTAEYGVSYDVEELKEELYKIVSNSDYTIDDFYSDSYPYFEDLIFSLYEKWNEDHPPNLFSITERYLCLKC